MPCGRAHLVIEHPRYAKLDRVITLVAGTPLELKLNLQRPQLHLRVISKPSGAAVTVDGNSIGRAPAVTTVSGFEMLTVSVNLAGYTAWSQKVYVKKDMMVVNASLQRAGRKHR